METTRWNGREDKYASNPSNWDSGLPNNLKTAVFPKSCNECCWDISDFTISTIVEGYECNISLSGAVWFGRECYAPESVIFYVENLDRPPPGYIGVGDKNYKYSVFQKKWIKLFPHGLQAGAINTWDNSDADNVYSNDNNWSLGHKPAGTEDIVIPDTTIIGKCTMDENSAADLASFTMHASGEFELVTFILDVDGNITLSGTFTRGTGTLQLGGGAQQNITSGGNALYHVVVTGANTIYYTKDSTEIFDIDVQANATFEVDAVSEGGALTITYSDIANCGLLASAGNFLCQGSGANGVTITAANPGSNYWDFESGLDVTADYTTFSSFTVFKVVNGTMDIENCTFSQGSGLSNNTVTLHSTTTVTSFTNITIDNMGYGIYFSSGTHTNLQNVTITNSGSADILIYSGNGEFTDSNFDETSYLFIHTTGSFISKNHNDVAGDYQIAIDDDTPLNKSTITNDYTSSDNVTIRSGTLTVDEASASISVEILSGATFDIDAAGTGASLTHTFSDVANCGFVATTAGTLLCQGDITNGVTMTSVGSPPTNYWNVDISFNGNDIILTYTTIEYFDRHFGLTSDMIFNNVTIQNPNRGPVVRFDRPNPTWNNVTIDADNNNEAILWHANAIIDNVVILNPGSNAITIGYATVSIKGEASNSNFDETKVNMNDINSSFISSDHKDVAGDWLYWSGSNPGARGEKSNFTNDYTSTDNVTIYEGLLTVDEAAAHNDLTIKNGGTFDVNGGITETITNTGTVTVESGGTLEWTGSAGNLITLVSDVPGTQWSLVNNGTVNVAYVNVKDSDATAGNDIDATDGTNINSGNNLNWLWPQAYIGRANIFNKILGSGFA